MLFGKTAPLAFFSTLEADIAVRGQRPKRRGDAAATPQSRHDAATPP